MSASPTSIAILLYPGFTLLDAVGPYEILSRLSDVDVRFVAVEPGPVVTDSGMAHLLAQALNASGTHDVVLVPGGVGGSLRAAQDPRILGWLAAVAPRAQWIVSVCTGSLILGAAGLLRGRRATSHWLTRDRLAAFDAIPSARRVEIDGPVMTAAGVSAGIDLGLVLAARLRGDDEARAVQLVVEYDPAPPFACGNVADSPPHIVARATGMLMDAFRHDASAQTEVI